MFIVRNVMSVQLGRRSEMVGFVKEVMAEAHKEIGVKPVRILTGSIGPSDQEVVLETEHETLASFEADIAKMNGWAGMAKYAEKWTSLILPGSTRFEVYRVQD